MPEADPTDPIGVNPAAHQARRVAAGGGARQSLGVLSAAGAVVRDPVIAILTLAGIFDGISGNPVHAILLFVVAGALGRDAVLQLRVSDDGAASPLPATPATLAATESTRPPIGVILLLAVAYALIVGGFGRFSWPATTSVLIPAGAGLAIAWRRPRHPGRDPGRLDPAGAVVWMALFLALALWELVSLLLQPSLTTDSYAHPTISVMMDPVLASHVGRSIGFFFWLAFGWFLLER